MGGFFGVVSKERCINDLFYGTDYQSHLGTSRATLNWVSSAASTILRMIISGASLNVNWTDSAATAA